MSSEHPKKPVVQRLLSGRFEEISLNLIDPPKDPVRGVDAFTAEEMGISIENDGLYSPVTVRPRDNGRFEVVAGNHRYEAIRRKYKERVDMKALPPKVPCIIRELSDDEAKLVSISENIQRNPHLDAIREGEIFSTLVKKGWTPERIQFRIGKKRIDYVTNRLLIHDKMHEVLKTRMKAGNLPMRIAVVVAGQPLDEQLRYYNRITKTGKSAQREGCSHNCPAHCPEYEA